MSVAIKVNKSDLGKWIKKHNEMRIEKIPEEWKQELKLDKNKWRTNSIPRYYKINLESYMLVYLKEGIIYKKLIAT